MARPPIFATGRERSHLIPLKGDHTGFVTVHPSCLLCFPDEGDKARPYAAFVANLKAIKELAGN